MKVIICAAVHDQGTAHIADLMQRPLEQLSESLSASYGGEMEHLWIDLELRPGDADHRKPWPFRFQKVVALPRLLRGFNLPVDNNVGRYSVRPDYFALAEVPADSVVQYLLTVIYASTSILEQKQKRLPGFNARQFRADFIENCRKIGYSIDERGPDGTK